MAEKSDTISLGTEAWNVADAYVKLMVLKQLVFCTKLENIAMFGTEDIDQDLEIPSDMIPQRRITGLKRLIDNLDQLFANVRFAIKLTDKERFDTCRARVKLVESMYDGSFKINIDDVAKTQNLEINEEFFKTLLNELREIREMLNIPINNAGLIFRSSDEVDFDSLLKQLSEEG